MEPPTQYFKPSRAFCLRTKISLEDAPVKFFVVAYYLYDSVIFLPILISPLSIRKLKPQSGLLQTQAL